MSLPELCIRRPVMTTLLLASLIMVGVFGYRLLPVAALPRVDVPTIQISAALPGASPETMAATVATPLERALGRIAGVTEMTSSSALGSTRVTLQFDLNRDIDGAARESEGQQRRADRTGDEGRRKIDAPVLQPAFLVRHYQALVTRCRLGPGVALAIAPALHAPRQLVEG